MRWRIVKASSCCIRSNRAARIRKLRAHLSERGLPPSASVADVLAMLNGTAASAPLEGDEGILGEGKRRRRGARSGNREEADADAEAEAEERNQLGECGGVGAGAQCGRDAPWWTFNPALRAGRWAPSRSAQHIHPTACPPPHLVAPLAAMPGMSFEPPVAAVDPLSLEADATKKKRRSAQRLLDAFEARAETKFKGKHVGGGTTNREKARLKNFSMLRKSSAVQAKVRKTLMAKQRSLKSKISGDAKLARRTKQRRRRT